MTINLLTLITIGSMVLCGSSLTSQAQVITPPYDLYVDKAWSTSDSGGTIQRSGYNGTIISSQGWDYSKGMQFRVNWQTIGAGAEYSGGVLVSSANFDHSLDMDTRGGGFSLTYSDENDNTTSLFSVNSISIGSLDYQLNHLGGGNFLLFAQLNDSSGRALASGQKAFVDTNLAQEGAFFQLNEQRVTDSLDNGMRYFNSGGQIADTAVITVTQTPEPSSCLFVTLSGTLLLLKRKR